MYVTVTRFKDRNDAAEQLAEKLGEYRHEDTVVYALPRGGVPLGMIVAKSLGAGMDLLIPRKIGHPANPEYAIGAVTENGTKHFSPDAESVDPVWLDNQIQIEKIEAQRRQLAYLGDRVSLPVRGKTAIIVDDGIATGLTMLAAISDLKSRKPGKIVVAVPVMPADTISMLKNHADEVVAVLVPEHYLGAVGAYYDKFEQVKDSEVINLLKTTKEKV